MSLHVLFKVGGVDYALPAKDVLHLESYSPPTKVPGAPDHVAGLLQIRRRVVPVVDLRARFGLPKAEPTLDSRVVVVQEGERAVGLLADSAREVLTIPPAQLQAPPEVVLRRSQGLVTGVAQVGARLIMLVDTRRLVGEEVTRGV